LKQTFAKKNWSRQHSNRENHNAPLWYLVANGNNTEQSWIIVHGI